MTAGPAKCIFEENLQMFHFSKSFLTKLTENLTFGKNSVQSKSQTNKP